jgi:hypothetical protein
MGKAVTEIALTFEVELIEDLHTGTGVGRLGLLDDTQSRDQAGRPVVWSSAFRGLLREAALDWLEARRRAGLPDDDRGRVTRLLGWRGDQRSTAVVRSLRLGESSADGDSLFTVWASAAREVHSRRPDDRTLRFIEFARSGLRLHGEIRLPSETSSEDVAFLKQCLQRLTAVGGRKTRGWGQLRLLRVEEQRLGAPAECRLTRELVELPEGGPIRLRLLLQNLEPLNLARTAFAGNLIFSQSFVPGSALRGAVLHWLSRQSHNDLATRLAVSLQVSNAYVLPGEKPSEAWDRWEVIPLPLSLKEPKGGSTDPTADTSRALPWWARLEGGDARLRKPAWDQLAEAQRPEVPDRPGDRRIKSEEYLVLEPGETHWRRVRPKMGVLLRNSVPTARLDPDSRRSPDDPGGQEDSLFSEQVLWEDQFFLTELLFEDRDAAKEFVEAAAPLLEGHESKRSWLRVGRKGRPVRVKGARWFDGPAKTHTPPAETLTLTLTSDLIARTPWLMFPTKIDLPTLQDLISKAGEIPPLTGGLVSEPEDVVCEPVEVYGFNGAAGLPRSPAVAIKRGSVFRMRATSGQTSSADLLLEWRRTLQGIGERGVGLGDRTVEGFGRFVLDLDVHDPSYWDKPVTMLPPPVEALGYNWREVVLATVELFVQQNAGRLATLSATQWQWLRSRARGLTSAEGLDKLLADLPQLTDRLGARERWHPLLPSLVESVRRAGLSLDPQMRWRAGSFFLDALVQEAIARLRQAREWEGGK